VSKPKLKWAETADDVDYEGATKYLSLLCPDHKAKALAKNLRAAKPLDHAAKDLLRASRLPLLPRDDPHVTEDLKRVAKAKALPPVLLVRGDAGGGLPLIVADGYHRICAVYYFDEESPVRCQIVGLADKGA
jgi:hypothetical protein